MKLALRLATASALALAAMPAAAVTYGNISVTNASFETNPQGTFSDCGFGCLYTFASNGDIPGWVRSPFSETGLFRPAVPRRFNSVPDGITVVYSNGGSISQTVGVTAEAGVIYILKAMVGLRNDGFANPGTTILKVGLNSVLATGVAPTAGNWSPFTATYRATAADNNQPITILLNSVDPQGGWDMVSLSAVPEPATWAMLIVGFGMVGFAARRSKAAVAA